MVSIGLLPKQLFLPHTGIAPFPLVELPLPCPHAVIWEWLFSNTSPLGKDMSKVWPMATQAWSGVHVSQADQ